MVLLILLANHFNCFKIYIKTKYHEINLKQITENNPKLPILLYLLL